MMIIKEGDPSRADTIRRFQCPVCGCVWEANASEYIRTPSITSMGQVLQFSLRCNCPCCNFEVAEYENVVQEANENEAD